MTFKLAQLREALGHPGGVDLSGSGWSEYLNVYQLAELSRQYSLQIFSVGDHSATNMVQHYQQRGSSLGSVIIVHGYMDHCGLYRHLIAYVLEQGWDVLIYDQRGHGLSSGERYAIDDFAQYSQELTKILHDSAARLRGSWVLIGQSTGGAVVMEHSLCGMRKRFDRIEQSILLAPLVRSAGFNKVRLLHRMLHIFRRKIRRAPSNSSHDLDFLDFINNSDPLRYRFIKLSWVGAMIAWQRKFESSSVVNDSLVVIQGDNDDTVDWQYNIKAITRVFTKVEVFAVPGAKHHLVNEAPHWRQQVFDKIGFCLRRQVRRSH